MVARLYIGTALAAGVSLAAHAGPAVDRQALIARAEVWQPVATARLDLARGPDISNGFRPGETIVCRYDSRALSGSSPKFACDIGKDDSLKVKYGGTNGEVFAETAATRLLWALGFGADAIYPVRIVCQRCPEDIEGIERESGDLLVSPATVERKFPAPVPAGLESEGWSWRELDLSAAPKAHRDALKLLAVFLQHTDNKTQQQRIVCLDGKKARPCHRPFLMVNDVGLTFGRATRANVNAQSSANLAAWSRTPVFNEAPGCIGNLPRSFTGTLDNPVISEEGRAFLAGRLALLSDVQIQQMFTVARFDLRPRDPADPKSELSTVSDWVAAFKAKRSQIANRRCA